MKLIIVLGVEAAGADIRKLFQAGGVEVYSELPMQGHRLAAAPPDPANWFGIRHEGVYSTLAFAFASEAEAAAVLAAVRGYNAAQHTDYPLHGFQLAVEAII